MERSDNGETGGGTPAPIAPANRNRQVGAPASLLVLLLLYAPFLRDLWRLSAADELASHIPLIPCVVAYLVFLQRQRLSSSSVRSRWIALLPAAAGIAALVLPGLGPPAAATVPASDALFWPMVSLVCFVPALVAGWYGGPALRALWFPLAFLVFLIPVPAAVVQACSVWLQYATVDALDRLLGWTGTPFYREGIVFQLSGLQLEVALACSGIRSTLVLLITSLLAGHLLLDRTWKKIVLIAVVIPLGVLRNAVRITSLALLSIHVDERIIDGPLHSRGGPLFFALSLVVLLALVLALRAMGRKRTPAFQATL